VRLHRGQLRPHQPGRHNHQIGVNARPGQQTNQPRVATLVPSPARPTRPRITLSSAGLEAKFSPPAEHLATARSDLLAFTAFPVGHSARQPAQLQPWDIFEADCLHGFGDDRGRLIVGERTVVASPLLELGTERHPPACV
jgi:hypothetical protein